MRAGRIMFEAFRHVALARVLSPSKPRPETSAFAPYTERTQMSSGLGVYAVSIDQLQRVLGSRDSRWIKAVQ